MNYVAIGFGTVGGMRMQTILSVPEAERLRDHLNKVLPPPPQRVAPGPVAQAALAVERARSNPT